MKNVVPVQTLELACRLVIWISEQIRRDSFLVLNLVL